MFENIKKLFFKLKSTLRRIGAVEKRLENPYSIGNPKIRDRSCPSWKLPFFLTVRSMPNLSPKYGLLFKSVSHVPSPKKCKTSSSLSFQVKCLKNRQAEETLIVFYAFCNLLSISSSSLDSPPFTYEFSQLFFFLFPSKSTSISLGRQEFFGANRFLLKI